MLPSGDTYALLWGRDRELLVPDAGRRSELWTSRVWPGAMLVGGEIVGTWRRANEKVAIQAWRRLSATEQEAVEATKVALDLKFTLMSLDSIDRCDLAAIPGGRRPLAATADHFMKAVIALCSKMGRRA